MKAFPDSARAKGFSLLEILVVLALIGFMSAFLLGRTDSGVARHLAFAQGVTSECLTVARMKSAATGRKTRLLVLADPALPDRYLRYLVLQLARQPGGTPADWDLIATYVLPPDVYIVPGSLTGLVESDTDWRRPSDATSLLISDLFANQAVNVSVGDDPTAHRFTGIAFTPNGTLASLGGGPPPKGSIVIAPGVRVAEPATSSAAPVRLVHPEEIRGLLLSAYGVPALLNSRDAF